MTHPTDEELNALKRHIEPLAMKAGDPRVIVNGRTLPRDFRIIAEDEYQHLRAKLAEVQAEIRVTHACNRGLVRLNEATQDRADRAEAALAAQIEADAWQPIDTAPTDYTHVIGIDAKGCVARTWFFAPSSLTRQWLRVGLPGKAVWHPTHWKPLRETTAQPHDRTALDRMLREAILEGMRIATFTPIEQVPSAVDAAILALIEQEPPHD